ncbi:MAG: carbamate kinase [Deltaproteobacteria bacterium]|nr:carbamate kinase [Candidatus Zymogenaceae bacterium]
MSGKNKTRTAVVALGGNAIIKEKETGTISQQFRNTRKSLVGVVGLIRDGWDVLITHGNGPQVGNRLISNEMAHRMVPDMPLGVLCGDTEGAMGYMIQQSLFNKLIFHSIKKPVVTVITQTVVDAEDLSMRRPTKPVGPFFSEKDAQRLTRDKGWRFMEDAGRGFRQAVPSPYPLEIVEIGVIERLLTQGIIVVAIGGGGIPVVRQPDGTLEGIDCIIDKDLASSLAARMLTAELFVMVTGVDKVALNYRKPDQVDIDRMSVDEAKRYQAEGHFFAGSMGPKIKAATEYLDAAPKGRVVITSPEGLKDAVAGHGGTVIEAG